MDVCKYSGHSDTSSSVIPPKGEPALREIPMLIQDNGSIINLLEELTNSLEERLSPVLRTEDSECPVKDKSILTPLGNSLSCYNQRLTKIANRIQSVLNRLEI